MRILLELLIVAGLPGAVLMRVPWAGRDRRAALPGEERAFWAVVISVAISLALALILAALDRYSLRHLLVLDIALTLAVAAAARRRLSWGPAKRRTGAVALIPVALLAIAYIRFLPPAEYVIGGKDPGVYVSEGIRIAQRGSLVAADPTIARIPDFARVLFIPQDMNRDRYVAVRFMGFYVLNPDTGTVVGQFPHLFPASIAIGYGINGLTGAREAVGVWAALGLLAVYFLGARFLGWPAAAAAALLLSLNVIQVWFSRYPNADIVMQAFGFAALLAAAKAQIDEDAFFAPVAGALLGLLLFLRFDAVIMIAAVVAATVLGRVVGFRMRWTFWLPLIAAAALCVPYLDGPMHEYWVLPLLYLTHLPAWEYMALALAVLIGAVLTVGAERSKATTAFITAAVPIALGVAVAGLTFYALFLRHPGGKLTDYDAYALRTYASFYVTIPGLLAALVGYLLVVRRLFWRDPAFVLTFTGFCIFFFYKIRIVPDHFWMARRFVPIILPGTLLFAAAAALTGVRGRLAWTRALRAPIGIAFLALLAVHYARAASPIADHVEYAGIIPHLEALTARVGPNDLLIAESRDTGSDIHVLALPLAYIYDRHVLVLANAAPDKATFAAFLNQAHAHYERILFLGSGGTDLLSSRWSVAPIASERFQVPEYDAPTNAYPRFVSHKEFDYSLYVFGPPQASPPPDLVIGIDDDLNVLRFHAKEQTEGHPFRWTEARSVIVMPRVPPNAQTLALWMSDGGRPPAAPPATVAVEFAGQPIGAVTVGHGFSEYDLRLPAALVRQAAAPGEPVRITLRSTTWNPLKTLGSPDPRDLGVMVDRVALR